MESEGISFKENTKRILELDLTKGIGVFFIPMAHTLEKWLNVTGYQL